MHRLLGFNLWLDALARSNETSPGRMASRPDGLRACRVCDSGSWPRWRYVEATTHLEAGHVVCAAAASAVAVSEEWKRRVCSNCFHLADARLPQGCANCDQCAYCSDACKIKHKAAHESICPALQKWPTLKKAGKETMAVLRLLLEVLAREHANSINQSSDEHVPGCPNFRALQHHPAKHDTPKEASDWSKACASFRSALEACEWCNPAAWSDDELHALTSRIDSNCFGVYKAGVGGDANAPTRRAPSGREVDLLGRGLYLDAALFNHSCAPNCSVSAGALSLEVILDEAVEEGDELTISYCDTQQPLAARRKHLKQAYHFDCMCERCVAEAANPAASLKLAYHSGGGPPKAPASKRERRERREERNAAKSTTAGSGCTAALSEPVEVRVIVDLRVLLKLAPKAKAPGAAVADKKQRKAKGGAAQPLQVPTCSVRLRTAAVVAVE